MIDTHGNKALDLGEFFGSLGRRFVRPDLRVRGSEGRNTLNRREEDLANVGTVAE